MSQSIHFSIFYKNIIDDIHHDETDDYYDVLIKFIVAAEKDDRKRKANNETIPFTSFITTLETFKNHFGPSIEIKHNSRARVFITDQKLFDDVKMNLLP